MVKNPPQTSSHSGPDRAQRHYWRIACIIIIYVYYDILIMTVIYPLWCPVVSAVCLKRRALPAQGPCWEACLVVRRKARSGGLWARFQGFRLPMPHPTYSRAVLGRIRPDLPGCDGRRDRDFARSVYTRLPEFS